MTNKDENLPAFQVPTRGELRELEIPLEVQMVKADDSIERIREADVAVCNLNILMLHKAWDCVYTVGQAIDLAKATVDMCAKRRMLLNKPVGADAPKIKSAHTGELIPL